MESKLQFKVSFKRLEKPRLEPKNPGIQVDSLTTTSTTITSISVLFQSTKYNNPLNRFTVHTFISLTQRKLLRFGYLYPLEFESILISQNHHCDIFINA